MSKTQSNKIILSVVMDRGRLVQELEVPTDSRADDEDLYKSLDNFVAQNTEYGGIEHLLNIADVNELNSLIKNQGGVSYRGMTVTQIKYPE